MAPDTATPEDLLEDPSHTSPTDAISAEMKQEMERPFTPTLPKQSPIKELLDKIPLLASFLKRVNSAAGHLHRLSEVVHIQETITEAFSTAAPALPVVNVTLLSLDFLRIPLIYLAAKIVGQDPPFTLSNNARWLYSAVLLALTITALAVPAVAPIIAITVAAVTLADSLVTMGKIIYDRYKHLKEQKELEHTIDNNTRDLKRLCQEADALEKQIVLASPTEIAGLSKQLTQTRETFGKLLKKHKIDLQKKSDCDHELKKKGTIAMMDKGVSLSLACLGLAALVTSLFFPPLGLSLLLGTALLGATYFLGRITTPLFKTLFTRMFGTKTVASHSGDSHEDHDLLDSKQEKHTSEKKSPTIAEDPAVINTQLIQKGATIADDPVVEDSTTITMGLLTPHGMVTPMHHQSPWLNEIQNKLSTIVDSRNLAEVTTFFTQLAWTVHTKYPKATTAELSEFFNNLEDTKPVFLLFQQALQTPTLELSDNDKQILLGCAPLMELLHDEGIHLESLFTPTATVTAASDNDDESEGESPTPE